jgi:hypothetical protein
VTRRVPPDPGKAAGPEAHGVLAYREVTMIEIKEVFRLWVSGTPKKRIAVEVRLDPKTVRREVKAAEASRVRCEDGLAGLT